MSTREPPNAPKSLQPEHAAMRHVPVRQELGIPTLSRAEVERRILATAARQHGVITRAQLLRAGLSPGALVRRVASGSLRPIHRGVYLLGPVAPPLHREMAAVLACGWEAVVCHWTAARLWELLPGSRRSLPVDISLPRDKRVRRRGLVVHRTGPLRPDEVTRREAIPVTTPARTLLDLAAIAATRELEQALARALARDLSSRSAIAILIGRYPRRRGTATLRALLESGAEPRLTESTAEELFLELVGKAKLADPESNVEVCGHRVDFYWRAHGLVVEVDGFAFHSSAERFEDDRERDTVLEAAGVRVMRATWRQLVEEPEALIVRVAQALARSGGA